MKQVTDQNTGEEVTVPFNTPCHAGKNGALPIMYDAVIDAAIFADMAEKEAVHVEDAPLRAIEAIKQKIAKLEAEQTPRRMREHALGIDNGWLADLNALIAVERNKL